MCRTSHSYLNSQECIDFIDVSFILREYDNVSLFLSRIFCADALYSERVIGYCNYSFRLFKGVRIFRASSNEIYALVYLLQIEIVDSEQQKASTL